MRNTSLAMHAIGLLLTLTRAAQADTIHVPGDYPLIQSAIDAAVDGDSVVIDPGTYVENLENYKRISIMGTSPSDSAVVASTIIRAAIRWSTATLHSGILDGVTVTGGSPGIFVSLGTVVIRRCFITDNHYEDFYGGGVSLDGGSVTVENCTFRGNSSQYAGGAVGMILGDPLFRGCLFENNSSSGGGAVFAGDAQPTFVKCVFRGNVSEYGGGAVTCDYSIGNFEGCTFDGNNNGALDVFASSITITTSRFTNNTTYGNGAAILSSESEGAIRNCLISHNRAGRDGGGISAMNSDMNGVLIENCTIVENTAGSGGGAFSDGNDALLNCIVWGNTPDQLTGAQATSCDVQGGWPGIGNIDTDPQFRSLGSYEYLLGMNSPCIDAGDPTVLDGVSDWHPRWPGRYDDGPRSDMGAYGGPDNVGWLR